MASRREAKHDFLSVRPCGADLFELIPRKSMRIDLSLASGALAAAGYDISEVSEMALTASGPYELSIFPNGKMMVFPAKTNDQAERIGAEIFAILNSAGGCVDKR